MTTAAAAEIFLRAVPDYLMAGVRDGTLRIYGSSVREVSTGRIAGFLQEAAPVGNLAIQAANGPLGPLDTAMNAMQLAQGEMLRQGVQRLEQGVQLLQVMGVASLALSAAGLGVSVVGFAVMSRKIDRVQSALEGVAGDIQAVNAKLDRIQQDAIDADFSELRALAKALDEGWLLSEQSAQARWRDVAQGALVSQSRFELRAERILANGVDHYAIADRFLDALSVSNALRVAALAATGETVAAKTAADDGSRSLERITGSIGAADLSLATLRSSSGLAGSEAWTLAQAKANVVARAHTRKMRQREAAAATRAGPIALLESQSRSVRDWLASLREETHSPITYLSAKV